MKVNKFSKQTKKSKENDVNLRDCSDFNENENIQKLKKNLEEIKFPKNSCLTKNVKICSKVSFKIKKNLINFNQNVGNYYK